jgi:general secretion pathway protein G
MRTRRSKAFTLVEILIVVVILGILAAIVVPQFTSASQQAQAGNVATQLQTIRSQIELYRVRNNGAYPPSLVAGGAGATAWADLVGADYMRAMPVNPHTSSADVTAGTTDSIHGAILGAAGIGWYFNTANGNIAAAYFDEEVYNGTAGVPGDPVWTGP